MISKNILFVHGMYMNGQSWTPWMERAEVQGFTAVAPSWPFHNGEPEFLRAHIDPALVRLQFKDIITFYKKYIDSLPERPALVGHSVGGLVVQKLINDGYGTAAVSISPAPPMGIFSLAPEFLKTHFPHTNYFAVNKPLEMSKKRFKYAFCNTMDQTDSDAAFDRYVVPESRRVPQSILTKQGKIQFKKAHAPLLFLTGENDNLIPLALVKRNVKAYRKSEGVVDFQAFKNRSHFICNQDGWEEIADKGFTWLSSQ